MFEIGFLSPNLQKYLPTAHCCCQPCNVQSSWNNQLTMRERSLANPILLSLVSVIATGLQFNSCDELMLRCHGNMTSARRAGEMRRFCFSSALLPDLAVMLISQHSHDRTRTHRNILTHGEFLIFLSVEKQEDLNSQFTRWKKTLSFPKSNLDLPYLEGEKPQLC